MADATATLPDDTTTLQQLVRELLVTVTELRSTIQKQQDHIQYLVRMTFGRRSERLVGPTLFDDHPAPEPPPTTEPEPTPVVVTKTPGHGRRTHAKNLPQERVVIDLTEAEKACPCCGDIRVKIGEELSNRLDYRPACLFVQVIARPTYLCKSCERKGEPIQAVQAPLPPEPIPKGTCAAGLLAHVIVSKWCDHLPLYRLEGILGRLGYEVSRSTLCDQLSACARVLTPLYQLMGRRVRQSFALHTDDTPVTLLSPRRTAHAWVYVGDAEHPYTVFDLTVGRQQEFPQNFLAGYRGYIHADGYAGYNPLYAQGATHVGCWAHARRYFFEAKDSDTLKANIALGRIRALYEVEAEIKDMTAKREPKSTLPELTEYRRQRAGPLLRSFADWLAEEVPRALPKSKIGEAFIYAANQWPTLTRYLEDGRLTIDNALAEQAIRPLAVGRRNWLQIAGNGGLPTAAVYLSVAASAKRHRINPWTYIKHLLIELPARSPHADLTDLLPDVWANSTPAI